MKLVNKKIQLLSLLPLILGLMGYIVSCSTGKDVKLTSDNFRKGVDSSSAGNKETPGAKLIVETGVLQNKTRINLTQIQFKTTVNLGFLPPKTREIVENEVQVKGTLKLESGKELLSQIKSGASTKWTFDLTEGNETYVVSFDILPSPKFPFEVPAPYSFTVTEDIKAPDFVLKSGLSFQQDTGTPLLKISAESADPTFVCNSAILRNSEEPISSEGHKIVLLPELTENSKKKFASVGFAPIPANYEKPSVSLTCADDLGNASTQVSVPSKETQSIGISLQVAGTQGFSQELSNGTLVDSSLSSIFVNKIIQNKKYVPLNAILLGETGLPLATSIEKHYASDITFYTGVGDQNLTVPSTIESAKTKGALTISGYQPTINLEIPESDLTEEIAQKAYVLVSLKVKNCPENDVSSPLCVTEEKVIGTQLLDFTFDSIAPTFVWNMSPTYVYAQTGAVITGRFKVTSQKAAPLASTFSLMGIQGNSTTFPVPLLSSSISNDTINFTFNYPFPSEQDFRVKVIYKDIAGNTYETSVSPNLVGSALADVKETSDFDAVGKSIVTAVAASKYLCRIPQGTADSYYQARIYLQNEGKALVTQNETPTLMGYAIKTASGSSFPFGVLNSVANPDGNILSFFGSGGTSVDKVDKILPTLNVTAMTSGNKLSRLFTLINLTQGQGNSPNLGIVTDAAVSGPSSGNYTLGGHLSNSAYGFRVSNLASGTAPMTVSNFECDL